MLRVRNVLSCICLATALGGTANLRAQTGKSAPNAPLPSAVLSAKNVFLSFTGQDFDYTRGLRQIYNQFYAEIKGWGYYTPVRSPGEADLVLQISFDDPLTGVSVSPGAGGSWGKSSDDPQLHLALLDPKTNIVLWTLVEHVPKAILQDNRDKNFDSTLHKLVGDLKDLTAPPAGS